MMNTDSRLAEVRKLMSALVAPDPNDENWVSGLTRVEVSDEIRFLDRFGRSEKWKNAVEKWALMVEDEQNPMDWAILQGAVWVGYAA